MYYKEHKKTGESLTGEQVGKRIVDEAVRQLDTWVYKELENLKHGKQPICLQFDYKTLYISGLFVKSKSKFMHQVYDAEKTIHVFYSKHASILYVLLIHAKHVKMAESLMSVDKMVAKTYDDIQHFKQLRERLQKSGLKQEVSIINDKLHEATCKYQHYMKDLEKNLVHAKYIKVWEKLK